MPPEQVAAMLASARMDVHCAAYEACMGVNSAASCKLSCDCSRHSWARLMRTVAAQVSLAVLARSSEVSRRLQVTTR